MSYEQISESTYYNNISYWNEQAKQYRDKTGEELYTI